MQDDMRRDDPCQCAPMICIYTMLLIGLPGAGKTTFVNELIRSSSALEVRMGPVTVQSINYDAIQESIIVKKNKKKCGGGDDDGGDDGYYQECDLMAWRQTRHLALEQLKQAIETHIISLVPAAAGSQHQNHTHNKSLLIVMDDNFHLRSMRREVYKVCQKLVMIHNHEYSDRLLLKYKYNIGFSVVHLNTSFEECVERNSKRYGTRAYVPLRVLEKMRDAFEPPREAWERSFLLRLPSTSAGTRTEENSEVMSAAADDDDEGNHVSLISNILTCMKESIISIPKSVDHAREEKDREINRRNKVHSVDRALRLIVGNLCKIDRKFAKTANSVKGNLLSAVRNDCVDSISEIGDLVDLFSNQFCAASDTMTEDEFHTDLRVRIMKDLEQITLL